MRSGDINECDVLMVWDETRQHLEDLWTSIFKPMQNVTKSCTGEKFIQRSRETSGF